MDRKRFRNRNRKQELQQERCNRNRYHSQYRIQYCNHDASRIHRDPKAIHRRMHFRNRNHMLVLQQERRNRKRYRHRNIRDSIVLATASSNSN